MSSFDSLLTTMKTEGFSAKKQLLQYTLHMLQNLRKPLSSGDKAAILEYAYGEVEPLLLAIANAGSYREKDLIFECQDLLLGLIMHLCPTPDEIPQDVLAKITLLVQTVGNERYIEKTLDKLFEQDSIEEVGVAQLLELVRQADDEYRRGRLYPGLVYHKEGISKLTPGAKALLTAHLTAELQRYLDMEQLSPDCLENLELAADVCRYFPDDALTVLLGKLLTLGHSNVSFYAADSLLTLGQPVPEATILALAQDLGYADLTYGMLGKHGKQTLFPQAYSAPEYLAKSDLVHWLMYPTELGKAPDQIEYLGKITYLFKKDIYYVFKFRSDSESLGDDLKNKWLIGWSNADGGTFSNFDEYALYEKGSVEATLKYIKKKLIG